MKLEQNIVQVQTLSTQTIQSLKILQMNTPELMDYVQEISMENPVLEAEFSAVSAAGAAGRGKSQMDGWRTVTRSNTGKNSREISRMPGIMQPKPKRNR